MSKQYEFVKAEQRSPEWFALRADGITATEVSVIAGLNPYKTPYQLYAEKLGLYTPAAAVFIGEGWAKKDRQKKEGK